MQMRFKNELFICNSLNIGDHIRTKRLSLGLLQKDLALQLKVSEETVTNWENGNTKPMINHLPVIKFFLGYNPFSPASESLADRILSYRIAKGLSTKKLGKLLCVNSTTIRSWELEKFKPSIKVLKKLEKIIAGK